jgi:P-type Cu+ transporter
MLFTGIAMRTNLDTELKDPVCGMIVTAQSIHRSAHMGHIFFFCSPKCKTKFNASPMQYMGTRMDVSPTDAHAASVPGATMYTCPMHP